MAIKILAAWPGWPGWLRIRASVCMSKPRHKPQSQPRVRPSWKARHPCVLAFKIPNPSARDSGGPPLPDTLAPASPLPCLRLASPRAHDACQMIASSVPSDNGRRDPACLVTGQQVRPDGIEDIFTSLMTRTSPAFISLYRTRTRTISPVIQFDVRAHTHLQARGLKQLDSSIARAINMTCVGHGAARTFSTRIITILTMMAN